MSYCIDRYVDYVQFDIVTNEALLIFINKCFSEYKLTSVQV